MRRPYRALLLHAMRPVPRVPRAQGKIRRGRRPLQAVLRELLTEKRMPRHLSPDEPRLPRFPLNRLRSTRFVRADLAAAPPVMETEAVTVDEGDRPGKKPPGRTPPAHRWPSPNGVHGPWRRACQAGDRGSDRILGAVALGERRDRCVAVFRVLVGLGPCAEVPGADLRCGFTYLHLRTIF